jgi:hypothetical protein
MLEGFSVFMVENLRRIVLLFCNQSSELGATHNLYFSIPFSILHKYFGQNVSFLPTGAVCYSEHRAGGYLYFSMTFSLSCTAAYKPTVPVVYQTSTYTLASPPQPHLSSSDG